MMQPEIKEAFEEFLHEEGEAYFGKADLTVDHEGEYADPEIFGAFLAFHGCWQMRPATGTFLDVTIGMLTQHDDRSTPAMNFGVALYHLPAGNYTLHAVQRLEGQSLDDAIAQVSPVETHDAS